MALKNVKEADAAAGGGLNSSALKSKKSKSSSSKDEKLSKRQRRLAPNDKHLWPQQPRIQNMEKREQAQLRVAGLHKTQQEYYQQEQQTKKDEANDKKKKKTLATPILDPSLALDSPEIKFGRLLGASDQQIRHKTVLQLQQYLKARCQVSDDNEQTGGLSQLDLLKLWKGLWHTLYMADKVAVQDELSAQLAKLIWSVAGTEEEDEYAGQVYLEIYGDDNVGYNDFDDDEDDEDEEGDDIDQEGEEDEDMQNEDEDSDEDVVLEEIVNTLRDPSYRDDGDEDEDEDMENENEDEMNAFNEIFGEAGDDEEEGGEDEDDGVGDSEVRHCKGAHLASLMVRTFFYTVRREWDKMDKYRVDKFYTLMRYMMHEVFTYMSVRNWHLGIIRLFNDVIYEEVLSQVPNGIRFHLIDVVLEELAKVNAKAPMSLTEATFVDCLEPYLALAQTGGGDKKLHHHVMEQILLKFLNEYSIVSNNYITEDGDDDSDKKSKGSKKSKNKKLSKEKHELVMDQVHVGSVAKFIFGMASEGTNKASYRKSLYKMYKKYMKRIESVGRDVVLSEETDDEDEEEQLMCMFIDDVKNKTNAKDGSDSKHDDGEMEDRIDTEDSSKKIELDTSLEDQEEETTATKDSDTEVDSPAKSGKKKRKKSKKKKRKESIDDEGSKGVEVDKIVKDGKDDEENKESKKSKDSKKDKDDKKVEDNHGAKDPKIGKQAKDSKHVDDIREAKEDNSDLQDNKAEEIDSPSSQKKKKRRKKKRKNSISDNEQSPEKIASPVENRNKVVALTSDDGEVDEPSKKVGKDKKKRVIDASPTEKLEGVETSRNGEETNSVNSSGKKRKNKRKRRKGSEEEPDSPAASNEPQKKTVVVEEEIVTISMAEQRKSRNVIAAEKESEETQPEEKHTKDVIKNIFSSGKKKKSSPQHSTPSRRVKFDKANEIRSYTVSMTKLKLATPTTPKATPERGILRKKESSSEAKSDSEVSPKRLKRRKL